MKPLTYSERPEYTECSSSCPIQVANGGPREQCCATLRMIVIGRYPYYLVLAESLKARVFNIPQDKWLAMSVEQRWAINQEFLDQAIMANEQIILATPPEKVPLGSTLEKELNYLASHGLLPRQVGDHWEVVR